MTLPRHDGFELLVLALLVAFASVASAADSPTTRAAKDLYRYRRDGAPIRATPAGVSPWDLEAAYRVQQKLARLELPRLGPVVGYKVAYASVAAQKQFGMSEPASGPFFAVQRIEHEGAARAADFSDLLMETEVAFVLSAPLGGRQDTTLMELRSAVRSVHPAFDLGNFPYAEGVKPSPPDIVAAGVGAHRFVLGPGVAPDRVDLKSLQLKLTRNGQKLRSSPASEVMGDPWESLRWFVNAHTRRGGTLQPGAIVLTGTAAPAYRTTEPAAMRGEYVGNCGPLGQVRLRIE